jgi:hypothetical protein
MSTTVETSASTPRGLRGFGSDDERFLRFFSIVQDAAEELGCVFFCWAGEGNELETDTMDGEDRLFGGFCGRDSGIGPAQRAKTTIWN